MPWGLLMPMWVPEGLSDKADFLWKAEQGHSVGLPLSQGMTSMLPWLLPSTEGYPCTSKYPQALRGSLSLLCLSPKVRSWPERPLQNACFLGIFLFFNLDEG